MQEVNRPALFPKKDALWQMLRRTSHIIGKLRERELLEDGITGDRSVLLSTIVRLGDDATPGKIAQALLLEPHSVSEQISRMKKNGLVSKVRDRKKKNSVRICLTEKGESVFLQSSQRRVTRKIMSVLNPEESDLLWSMLARLRDAALEHSGVSSKDTYPPSDQKDLGRMLKNARKLAREHKESCRGSASS